MFLLNVHHIYIKGIDLNEIYTFMYCTTFLKNSDRAKGKVVPVL